MKKIFLFALLFIVFNCSEKVEVKKEVKVSTKNKKVMKEKLYGIGPNGEKPSTLSDLKDEIKDLNKSNFDNKDYNIVVAMHDVQNDWSQSVILGIKETLAKYDLQIALITDGEFSIDKQISDYKQIKNMKPDILITLTVDAKETSPILHEIEKLGTMLIFIDALPEGFIPGKNCIGWAVGDCYTMGKAGAELLNEKIDSGKTIAMLNWSNKMFTVDRRTEGAREVFKKSDKIKFGELTFNSFHEIQNIIELTLKDSIIISGFWTVWDAPALEILKILNKEDKKIPIVTADLSKDIAFEISKKDSKIIATIADDPYSIGEIEGMLTIAALSGKKTSGYFVTPVIKVNRENLKEAWKIIYKEDLPSDISVNLNK